MVNSKEISENIRYAIISKYKISKKHKAISKDLGATSSTVHNVIKMFTKHGSVKSFHGNKKKLIREVFEC